MLFELYYQYFYIITVKTRYERLFALSKIVEVGMTAKTHQEWVNARWRAVRIDYSAFQQLMDDLTRKKANILKRNIMRGH